MLGWGLLWLLAACAPTNAEYDYGLGAPTISGQVWVQGQPVKGQEALVVAIQSQSRFVTMDDPGSGRRPEAFPQGETVYSHTARVAQVDADGRFRFTLADVASGAVIYVFSSGMMRQQLVHQRQVGVKGVRYHVDMTPAGDWRSYYYALVSPFMTGLLTEPRYALDPRDQQWVVDWVKREEQKLEAKAPPASAPASRR